MKNILPALLAFVLCSLVVPTPTARAQGTALTYQGRLNDAAGPASGTYDFQFTVRDALTGGSPVGVNPLAATLAVSNGLFTVTLDPGAGVFIGADRWLEIAVRTNGAAMFATLSPRQKLTAAPYAITAGSLTGPLPAGQLSGTVADGSLSANVALLNRNPQTFTGQNNFSGHVTLTDPSKSLTFPATAGANAPMINMFASGQLNANRMVIAHSPAFPNYGLQYEDPPDKFHFLGAGTAVMTVDLGTGRVGIGTPSPSRKLEVQGTNDVEIGIRSTDAGGRLWTIQSSGNVGGNVGKLQLIDRTAGASRLTIDPSGNVGIGATSPQFPLHIGNSLGVAAINGSAQRAVVENATANGRAALLLLAGPAASGFATNRVEVQVEASDNERRAIIGTASDHEVQFRQNNMERLTLATSGNVGIRLTNPQFPLHIGNSLGVGAINGSAQRAVVENATANGRAALLLLAGPAASGFATNRVEVQVEASDSERRAIIGTASDHEVQFRQNNQVRMTLATSGNVGIGTTAPTTKLEVAGTVKATAFLEEGSPASVIPVLGMAWIKPGTFIMGSRTNEPGRSSDEGPQTVVTLTKGFWMGVHEVTQGEYQTVIGSNPSFFTGDTNRPVEAVSWNSATNYCRVLTTTERTAGRIPAGWGYRLPTEAEWEYGCRAGARTTRFSYGDDLSASALGNYAWSSVNSGSTTHPVEQKLANSWGLMDMHGNVFEWCQDWFGTYPGGSVTDPQGAVSGFSRVTRGGGWSYPEDFCRSALRGNVFPGGMGNGLGFRVVLSPGQP